MALSVADLARAATGSRPNDPPAEKLTEHKTAAGALNPIAAIALVGALGVVSRWLARQIGMPVAGFLVGPILRTFGPARNIGAIYLPLVSISVAVILFEGGLPLDFTRRRG